MGSTTITTNADIKSTAISNKTPTRRGRGHTTVRSTTIAYFLLLSLSTYLHIPVEFPRNYWGTGRFLWFRQECGPQSVLLIQSKNPVQLNIPREYSIRYQVMVWYDNTKCCSKFGMATYTRGAVIFWSGNYFDTVLGPIIRKF